MLRIDLSFVVSAATPYKHLNHFAKRWLIVHLISTKIIGKKNQNENKL
jgi:hypothetical protein